MACIEGRSLTRTYGAVRALDGLNITLGEGRILGLIGPNGAGKSTLLQAIVGLVPCEGELRVMQRDPWTERRRLLDDVAFIADVAVLPRWLKVSQILDFMAGVHPRFDRGKAEGFLTRTQVRSAGRIRDLSKGMTVQLHLALVMAIDARLLVLDEPTLGLDLPFRRKFYETLLNDYFDRSRTVVISTHEVAEIEPILTDVAFLDHGRIVLQSPMEDLEERFTQLSVAPANLATARSLGPVHEQRLLGKTALIFDDVPRGELEALGEVTTPGLADLFVACVRAPGRDQAA